MAKVSLTFAEAFAAWSSNWLVCVAAWMAFASCHTIGKVFFPIKGFAALGFEHPVANMYFISFVIFLTTLQGPPRLRPPGSRHCAGTPFF